MAELTDDRMVPLCRILLYDKGEGDPYVTDRGLVWLNIFQETAVYGSSDRDSSGFKKVRMLDGVGLVNRELPIWQDTRLTQYGGSGGSWEERKSLTQQPHRKYRLWQYDTTAGVQWSRESAFGLPADPNVIFELKLPDVPSDWDPVTYPPFVRIELGNGTWGIHWDQNGAFLVQADGAVWDEVLSLPIQNLAFNGDDGSQFFYLRVNRGKIGISTDFGQSYVWYGNADGSAVTIPASHYTVRGQGGGAAFGFHQMKLVTGNWTVQAKNSFTSRGITATLLFDNPGTRYLKPSGTNVTFTDLSTPGAGTVKYKVTLTVRSIVGTPFTFYQGPEVYSVQAEYPVVNAGGSGSYTEPWGGTEGDVRFVQVSKPLELDQATAQVRIRRDASQAFRWSSGRWPKVAILLGHLGTDGRAYLTPVMVGYIDLPGVKNPSFNEAELSFPVQSLAWRFKRARWGKLVRPVLGGLTVNQALDRVLYSEGLFDLNLLGTPDYGRFRRWHPLGDLAGALLPKGAPENPFEYVPANETKWDTLTRIAGYLGMEVGITDDGTLFTVPREYVSPVVSQLWEASPATDLTALIQGFELRLNAQETATAVEVTGTSEWGEELLAWWVNGRAEGNPGAGDWCPWRESVIEELQGTVTPELLALRVQMIGRHVFPLKFEADVQSPVRLGISRRDQGQVNGEECAGGTSYDRYVVLTLEHVYNPDPSFTDCQTTAGLQRMTN